MIPRRTDSRIEPPGASLRVVAASALVTLTLGLLFVFVRAPHPFGWHGIDHYHDLALTLARGGGFGTTDVPWGYALFVAAFYRVFGGHPVVPLVAQVVLNAAVPFLLFALVRGELGDRVALCAAALVGIGSFNTVYASTLAADSVCTVLFLTGLLLFARGLTTGRRGAFAASGLLAGIAVQMRPNLILFPPVLASVALIVSRDARRRAGALALYVAMVAAALLPWTIRNWRLTGDFMPTSSHGGTQLWYGTLQTGPYLKSRADNPRSFFEAPAFDYTSLANRTLIVSVDAPCPPPAARTALRYWTDRDRTVREAARLPADRAGELRFSVPGQPLITAVYYYLDTTTGEPSSPTVFTPQGGPRDPFVFFVDDRHLTDIDRHGDLADVFDVIRALRAEAWNEAAGDTPHRDVRSLVARLLDPDGRTRPDGDIVTRIRSDPNDASLELADGSRLVVPRRWSGSITDVAVTGGLAAILCYARRSWASVEARPPARDSSEACLAFDRVAVNDVFYRAEPHMMRRYTALALDNIRRDPTGFALASLYRFGRVFVVEGTSDRHTAQQFAGGRAAYALAAAASIVYIALAAAGAVLAVRRGARVWLLLTPILYVPATICFVLTNQRYSVTVQPLLLAFCAVTLVALWDRRQRSATTGRSVV